MTWNGFYSTFRSRGRKYLISSPAHGRIQKQFPSVTKGISGFSDRAVRKFKTVHKALMGQDGFSSFKLDPALLN